MDLWRRCKTYVSPDSIAKSREVFPVADKTPGFAPFAHNISTILFWWPFTASWSAVQPFYKEQRRIEEKTNKQTNNIILG